MGFGPLFLGIMFLYDAQIALRHGTSDAEAYVMIDIFPDVLGWILLLVGLNSLKKRAEGFEMPFRLGGLMLLLSLFSFAKDTVFFSAFYSENVQSFAGEAVDLVIHLLELLFLLLLFRPMPALCRKKGEDKLALSHSKVPGIIYCEGVIFLLVKLARILPLPASFDYTLAVLSRLDLIFLVFLIWYGVITMFRTMMRMSD